MIGIGLFTPTTSVDAIAVDVAAIRERTDNLPDDPASETTAEAAKVAAEAASETAQTLVEVNIDVEDIRVE
jgi:hypothetical protein